VPTRHFRGATKTLTCHWKFPYSFITDFVVSDVDVHNFLMKLTDEHVQHVNKVSKKEVCSLRIIKTDQLPETLISFPKIWKRKSRYRGNPTIPCHEVAPNQTHVVHCHPEVLFNVQTNAR
jgi:hypothetical protein